MSVGFKAAPPTVSSAQMPAPAAECRRVPSTRLQPVEIPGHGRHAVLAETKRRYGVVDAAGTRKTGSPSSPPPLPPPPSLVTPSAPPPPTNPPFPATLPLPPPPPH